MSSTRDPKARRGHRAKTGDFFETPTWCVERLLEKYTPPTGYWIEPCAGRGAIIYTVNCARPGIAEWVAVEKNEAHRPYLEQYSGADHVLCPQDFLDFNPSGLHGYPNFTFDVSMSNPPFSLAEDVVGRSLQVARITVMLLRYSFLATAQRNDFMKNAVPDCYLLPDRPPFRGDGKTDSTDYAWLVWDREQMPRSEGKLVILNTTPLEVRKP